MSNRNRKSLLFYWSVRYFVLILVSMIVVVGITLFMIERNSLSNQNKALARMARDIAEEAMNHGGKMPDGAELSEWLNQRSSQYELGDRPVMFLLDSKGRIVQQHPPHPPLEADQLGARLDDIMTAKPHQFELEPIEDRPPFLVAVHPISGSGQLVGYAIYMTPKVNVLKGLLSFGLMQIAELLCLLSIGMAFVYLLTRRLVRPIRETVAAAHQIVAGNYDVRLNKEYQEREIQELMHAFKEMADRLSRLESLRMQLLAGVTHELKTPVTSISGLVQAVRDGVVIGEEAEVFLDHCLKQSNRLQNMIEDLLEFNRFAGNVVTVRWAPVDLGSAVSEIVKRWHESQQPAGIEVSVEAGFRETVWTDAARIEQILVNLLNNAKDAMADGGHIHVRLFPEGTNICLQVQDTGCGIGEDERMNVFEPFYRGEGKKNHVHGLGLGLPFSRLIARSLGGDLVLSDSGPDGTTFTLLLENESIQPGG